MDPAQLARESCRHSMTRIIWVSDMESNSQRFHAVRLQGAPKLKVAIVGGGLAGLSTAVELLDQG